MKNRSILAFQTTTLKGIYSVLIFLFLGVYAFCQTRQELEDIRFNIIKEIDETNKLLQETEKNRKAMLSDLQVINTQMANRKKLVNQINKEILFLDKEIELKEQSILQSQQTIDSLRSQYDLLLRAMYREKLTRNPIIEFFSDNLWKTIFLRNNYYNQLKQYLNNKLFQISTVQDKLSEEISLLNAEKKTKISYQDEITNQNAILENELDRQKTLIASLKEDEAALKEALEVQKNERERMNVAIEDIINSRFGQESLVNTNEGFSFNQRRGTLNWPVQSGVISSKYGRQPHPTLKNITVSNNGIDIRALNGSEALAVAPGKVVGVTDLAGYGKMIILKHNQYFTVYSKLDSVFVENGDTVEEGTKLGTLSLKNGVSEIHFEIWNNNKTENPENWLKR